MARQKDSLIGKKLGQYEILDEIGRGGMATVYRARQASINRYIAIKVLPQHFLHDPDFFERFKREVDVIAHLEHPHILPIYDYGEVDGLPFIAMRYLGGGSMAQMIRRGIKSISVLDRPFSQVAQALDHAHRQGVIHRDLKPGNIMLDEHNNAYLTDFGIARVLNSSLTGSAIIGTPAYMSPEQANGLPLDARSDIYSLGVVLFELVAGREPFEAETPMALLLKHISEPLPPVRTYRTDVPDALERVIAKSTAKNPNDRYSSASEMATDFSASLRGDTVSAPQIDDSPTFVLDSAVPSAPSAPRITAPVPTRKSPSVAEPATSRFDTNTPASQPVTEAPKRRGSPLALLAVLIVLVVAAGAAFLAFGPGRNLPAVVMPTAFPGAQIVSENTYRVSVPNEWSETRRSRDGRQITIWEAPENDAFVTLTLHQANFTDGFTAAVNDYEVEFYANSDLWQHMQLIDEDSAPDGSVRRSYVLDGEGGIAPGQMDVFYMRRGPYLAVVETYSAFSIGNEMVQVFQNMLDSLRVMSPAA